MPASWPDSPHQVADDRGDARTVTRDQIPQSTTPPLPQAEPRYREPDQPQQKHRRAREGVAAVLEKAANKLHKSSSRDSEAPVPQADDLLARVQAERAKRRGAALPMSPRAREVPSEQAERRRRLSVVSGSSSSRYSHSEGDATPGQEASDDEAAELLAHADSGPAPVDATVRGDPEHAYDIPPGAAERPSPTKAQVQAAEEVMYMDQRGRKYAAI